MATLTYVYAEQTAVLGPLSPDKEPGTYDLCRQHAQTLSVPRGWEVIRLPDLPDTPPTPQGDDLLALADAVREVGLRHDEVLPPGLRGRTEAQPDAASLAEAGVVVLGERGHLRLVADAQHSLRQQ